MNHITNKGLMYRIQKELSKFNSKKANNSIFFLMGKNLNRHCTRENIQTVNKPVERWLTL